VANPYNLNLVVAGVKRGNENRLRNQAKSDSQDSPARELAVSFLCTSLSSFDGTRERLVVVS